MKVYTFEIDGHADDYFLKRDVQQFFLKPIYRSDVKQAIENVKKEIAMRRHVFRDDTMKRECKVKEMELVLRILTRCTDKFPELQKEMFG